VNARFAFAYASRGLRRGGRRSMLAALCVAFGAMSLVSLQLLASAIMGVIDVDPRLLIGGDASLAREGRPLGAADFEELDRLRAEGSLAAYTATASVPTHALRVARTGAVYSSRRVLGVAPGEYPLLGAMTLEGKGDFAAALAGPRQAVVTRDLAATLSLVVGDELLLAGIPNRAPQRVAVSGVVRSAPDKRGDSIYVSLETARELAGRDDVVKGVDVLWNGRDLGAELIAAGWSVQGPAEIVEKRADVVDLFGFMLRGTGLLGLLLGGVGVSNTMKVLLARRRAEIAVLKSLGYRRHHLFALFGVEAAMLGLLGSVAGAAAGLLVSWWFVDLFGRLGEMLLEWAPDPRVVLGAVATGTATAVVFGMHAIVRASAVRPATLLRELATPPARVESAALYGALVAVFAAMCALVLGSIAKGAIVAVGGFAGLVALSAVLGAAFWCVIRLPVPVPPLFALARRNLRQQTGRVVVALVALVCGIFTIGFAGATMLDGQERLAARQGTLTGQNITVYADAADADAIEARLAEYGATVTRERGADGAPQQFKAEVPPERLVTVAKTLGGFFPSSVIVGKNTFNDAMQRTFENLFMFVAAVAGLALVAGAVLIANAVGLATIERRREIGILKAIGFGTREVLVSITGEYVLLGLLAGVFGLAGIYLAFEAINRNQPQAGLSLDLAQAVVILVVSPALAGLSAWLVARKPASERPLEVLRGE
jgi:predicted lysophospholipase L1 biosynthesis ABC-type transport system permease subunit